MMQLLRIGVGVGRVAALAALLFGVTSALSVALNQTSIPDQSSLPMTVSTVFAQDDDLGDDDDYSPTNEEARESAEEGVDIADDCDDVVDDDDTDDDCDDAIVMKE